MESPPAAIARCTGTLRRDADWKPRWYLLAVPTEAFMGSARSLFNLVAPDERERMPGSHSTEPRTPDSQQALSDEYAAPADSCSVCGGETSAHVRPAIDLFPFS